MTRNISQAKDKQLTSDEKWRQEQEEEKKKLELFSELAHVSKELLPIELMTYNIILVVVFFFSYICFYYIVLATFCKNTIYIRHFLCHLCMKL